MEPGQGRYSENAASYQMVDVSAGGLPPWRPAGADHAPRSDPEPLLDFFNFDWMRRVSPRCELMAAAGRRGPGLAAVDTAQFTHSHQGDS